MRGLVTQTRSSGLVLRLGHKLTLMGQCRYGKWKVSSYIGYYIYMFLQMTISWQLAAASWFWMGVNVLLDEHNKESIRQDKLFPSLVPHPMRHLKKITKKDNASKRGKRATKVALDYLATTHFTISSHFLHLYLDFFVSYLLLANFTMSVSLKIF